MAHNISRSTQDALERERCARELSQWLVPGWQLDRNRLEIVAIDTVLVFFQRRQELLLRCRKADCRRRVEVNLRSAIDEGKADKPIKHLIDVLRCGHWAGCELEEVSSIYPEGVPLVAYVSRPEVLIAIVCEHCGARLVLPPRQVITRLRQAGRGDGSTGILKLGGVIRGPCRKCGASRFRSELVAPKASGSG